MQNKLFPDAYIDSVYSLNFDKIYKLGFRGIIFDIDNTLVRHGAPANDKAVSLFSNLNKIGFNTCLLSNNDKDRVELFNKDINSLFIYHANKPLRKNYIKAMELMKTKPNTTLMIGDQIFTDLYGAKSCHIKTILTKPIHNDTEIQIVLKRILEKVVLFFYHFKRFKDEFKNQII